MRLALTVGHPIAHPTQWNTVAAFTLELAGTSYKKTNIQVNNVIKKLN